jgi:hypothetical protein
MFNTYECGADIPMFSTYACVGRTFLSAAVDSDSLWGGFSACFDGTRRHILLKSQDSYQVIALAMTQAVLFQVPLQGGWLGSLKFFSKRFSRAVTRVSVPAPPAQSLQDH